MQDITHGWKVRVTFNIRAAFMTKEEREGKKLRETSAAIRHTFWQQREVRLYALETQQVVSQKNYRPDGMECVLVQSARFVSCCTN